MQIEHGLIVGNKPQIDGTTGIDAYGNPVDPSVSGNMSRWTTCGFFGRLNYDYQASTSLRLMADMMALPDSAREISGSSSISICRLEYRSRKLHEEFDLD